MNLKMWFIFSGKKHTWLIYQIKSDIYQRRFPAITETSLLYCWKDFVRFGER